MPIVERTAHECFEVFTTHIRKLVAATVTARHPLGEVSTDTKLTLSFREGGPLAIPVETRFGRLHFYLGQALEAVADNGGFRLTTIQYWYRIQASGSLQDQAIVRWEYDASTGRKRHARHHAQMDAELNLGTGTLDLDKAHLPTGWVTIEEVIRFLIIDLEIAPPCGDLWPDVLEESERRFYEDFTSKRHKPPGTTG